MSKLGASVISVVMLGAVLAPIAQNFADDPQDSFPLSYYPMFTKLRKPVRRLYYLVGVDAQGQRRAIHYRYAGVGGLNQVRRQIRRLVRYGEADSLCATVAKRVGKKRKYRDLVSVRVIAGRYRYDDYFRGDKAPVSEEIRASCPIERSGA